MTYLGFAWTLCPSETSSEPPGAGSSTPSAAAPQSRTPPKASKSLEKPRKRHENTISSTVSKAFYSLNPTHSYANS